MKKLISFAAVLSAVFGLGTAKATAINDIRFYTEQFPPLNFKQDGKLTGIMVDVLEIIFGKMDSRQTVDNITLTEWNIALDRVMSGPNTSLFAIVKTPRREAAGLKWAGAVLSVTVDAIARKDSHIVISDDRELADFSIVVVKDDIGHQKAMEMGLPARNITVKNTAEEAIQELHDGRAEFMFYTEVAAKWIMKNMGLDPDDYAKSWTLQRTPVYYAFSKDVSNDFVEKFQEALDEVLISPQYQDIVDKYTR
ncbi:MAG: transporter substrate-binding domain-containing protein [Alphaproteobacteria bacterium]|nr:transporter substrate-binding domain-containing protein [Alphaproteobacteria bacterium]